MADNLQRQRDFYRQQCNELGARLLRLQEDQTRARREARRSRTATRLIRDLYQLTGSNISLNEIGQHFLQIILDTLTIDRAVLWQYLPGEQRFVPCQALGFTSSDLPDFIPSELPSNFHFANSTSPSTPLIDCLRTVMGVPYLLWAFNPRGSLALLLGNTVEDQHLHRPFEAGDQEIIEGALSIFIDLTERKRAEEELLKFKLGLERASDAIFLTDLDGVITYVNPAFEKVYGYTPEEAVGQTPRILKSGKIPSEVYVQFWQQLLNKESITGEIINRTKDGRLLTIAGNNNPILDHEGQLIGFLATHHDITEQKQAEQTIARQAEFLSKVIENLPVGIFAKEAQNDYRFSIWNAKMGEYLGYKHEDILGKTDYDINPPAEADRYRKADISVMTSGQILDIPEEKIFTGHGEALAHTIKVPIFDGEGQPELLLAILEDITERKRTEAQIRASLEEKVVLLKEIHHRVKNNLQVMSSLLYLQSQNIRDAATLEIFQESQNRIKAMALIHEKLYQSSDLARIDFAEYVRNLAGYLHRSYSTQIEEVNLKINVEDTWLDIDTAIPCGLIINELMSNALKYAFPTGQEHDETDREIRIELQVAKGEQRVGSHQLTLIVGDNGIGFPAGVDFRDTASLGLRLVNTLVHQLDGMVEMYQNGGTEFRIEFSAETVLEKSEK